LRPIYIERKGNAIKATIANLSYRMRDILKALERKEKVAIMYHGKQKGVIVPSAAAKSVRVSKHPFFGMLHQDTDVHEVMAQLRGGRYRAV
jgi:hypothetical protein